jgi:hypothetical protein
MVSCENTSGDRAQHILQDVQSLVLLFAISQEIDALNMQSMLSVAIQNSRIKGYLAGC